MRSSPLVLILFSLLLVSCEAQFDWPWLKKEAAADQRPTGQTSTQDRTIEPFDRIVLEGVGRLVFDPEVPAGILKITADEGLLSAVRASVRQGTLTIGEEGLAVPDSWELEFRVAPPAGLAEITLGGLGSIEAEAKITTTAGLKILIQGMGKIDLELEAPTVEAVQKGSGELVLRGKTGSVTVLAQGLGRVDVSELKAAAAEVLSQGVGEVEVYASEKLKVRAQGLGAVRFHGNPAATDVQTEGLTQVKAVD